MDKDQKRMVQILAAGVVYVGATIVAQKIITKKVTKQPNKDIAKYFANAFLGSAWAIYHYCYIEKE